MTVHVNMYMYMYLHVHVYNFSSVKLVERLLQPVTT